MSHDDEREMMMGREMIVGASADDYGELMHATAGVTDEGYYQTGAEYYETAGEYDGAYTQMGAAPPPPVYTRGRPQPGPPPPMMQRGIPVAYRGGPQGPRVVSVRPRKQRQFPVGFVAKAVPPGESVNVEVKPQVLFRGERLAVATSIARHFNIIDIKIGKDSQLAAAGDMPAESFASDAVGVRMELDTAQPGIVIQIRVQNVADDGQPHDFKAVLYGTVLD